MANIIEEKYIIVSREEILAWLVEQGLIRVIINLRDDAGEFEFEKFAKMQISKKRLDKSARFAIKKED